MSWRTTLHVYEQWPALVPEAELQQALRERDEEEHRRLTEEPSSTESTQQRWAEWQATPALEAAALAHTHSSAPEGA